MKIDLRSIFYLISFSLLTFSAAAQNDTLKNTEDGVYRFVDDSLFTNTGDTIFVGKKLIAGKGSGENGWYNSISFKSPVNWQSMMAYSIEDLSMNNPTRHDNSDLNLIKTLLDSGRTTFVVTKIKAMENKKRVFWHRVTLKINGVGNAFLCDIEYAIKTKEILIP